MSEFLKTFLLPWESSYCENVLKMARREWRVSGGINKLRLLADMVQPYTSLSLKWRISPTPLDWTFFLTGL